MDKPLKLGLDLKGGVHLVLRVKTDDALRLETEQEMERLRADLMTKGIVVGNITMPDSTHFVAEGVPPAQDAPFRAAAAELAANFDRSSGSNGTYTFTMKPNVQVNLREESVVQARETIERRVNELGVTEPSIAQQGANGDDPRATARGHRCRSRKEIIRSTGLLELKIVDKDRPRP
jgi:preprotein translocase subunit SecD